MLTIIAVNLMNIHQRIKEIILAYDLNNNFSQFSNIKRLPQVNMFCSKTKINVLFLFDMRTSFSSELSTNHVVIKRNSSILSLFQKLNFSLAELVQINPILHVLSFENGFETIISQLYPNESSRYLQRG